MRRSILAVCIVVAVIVLVTIPAAADITPPKKIVSPLFQEVWNALINLQGQINTIEKRIDDEIWPGVMEAAGNDIAQNLQLKNLNGLVVDLQTQINGKSKVVTVKGEISSGKHIAPPSPYTIDQCKIIVSPQRFDCPISPKSYLTQISVYPQDAATDWLILLTGRCVQEDGTVVLPEIAEASYLITCS